MWTRVLNMPMYCYLFSIVLIMSSFMTGKLYMLSFYSSFSFVPSLQWNIVVDSYTLLFIGILFLSFSVVLVFSKMYMIYSVILGYMFMFLIYFLFSMVVLVTSYTMVYLLVGWDLLGMTSFFLVIYYQSDDSLSNGLVTLFSNRIGDMGLMLVIWITVLYMDMELMWTTMLLILPLMLLLVSFTKSSQFPFISWLPKAMSAPTPVSTLVHSSTLVTGGLFLLFRYQYVFNSLSMNIILWVSVLTMLFSGMMASVEWDIKKVVAYSTMSQLSFMMFSFSMGWVKPLLFHLSTHALFKALLFLSVGSSISNNLHMQDMRWMSFINSSSTLSMVNMRVSVVSLMGLPFLSGFYSKDMILDLMLGDYYYIMPLLMGGFGLVLTIMYSLRLLSIITNNHSYGKVLTSMTPKSNHLMFQYVMMTILGGGMVMWVSFIDMNHDWVVSMPLMVFVFGTMIYSLSMKLIKPNTFNSFNYLLNIMSLNGMNSILSWIYNHQGFNSIIVLDMGWVQKTISFMYSSVVLIIMSCSNLTMGYLISMLMLMVITAAFIGVMLF